VDLGEAEFLGRLDDVRGRPVAFVISAFVYHVAAPRPLVPSAEVARAFWVPLGELLGPENRAIYRLGREGEEGTRPAIALRGEGDPPLWGLTYRMLESFLKVAGSGRLG